MMTLHIRQEVAGKKHKIRLVLKRSGQTVNRCRIAGAERASV
jgi:hypothetical protein